MARNKFKNITEKEKLEFEELYVKEQDKKIDEMLAWLKQEKIKIPSEAK